MRDRLRGWTPPRPGELTDGGRPETQFSFVDINVNDPAERRYLETTVKIGRYKSADPWRFYREIGEVHYAITRTARVAGYGEFVPLRVATGGRTDTPKNEVQPVWDIVDGIYSPWGGRRGLIERFYKLLKVAGEGYLIRVRGGRDGAGPVDGYHILSPSEIDLESFTSTGEVDRSKPIRWTSARVTQSSDAIEFKRTVQPDDFLGRIWVPDPEYVDMADSPLLAMKSQCEALIDVTNAIRGRLLQRFALAGILLIPNGINDAQIAGPTPKAGEFHTNKVMNYLITLMTRNVQHHASALGHIPALLMGPPDQIDKLKHVILDTQVSDQDLKLRADLVGQVLDGLDSSKRKAQDAQGNHWQSWSDSEDERRVAVQPDGDALAWIMERIALHPGLAERNWQEGKIRRWHLQFDLTSASVKTNTEENARLAWDRMWVGADFGRSAIGADADDAPVGAELVRMVGVKLGDPYLALYGVDGADGVVIDWDKVGTSGSKPGPDEEPGDESGRTGPGQGNPGSPSDRDSDTPRSQEPG